MPDFLLKAAGKNCRQDDIIDIDKRKIFYAIDMFFKFVVFLIQERKID
jgi:hypothetical protein